jgi:hypothetical protein
MRHPYHHHSRAWDEKSVGGDGANLIVDGITSVLGQLVPTRAKWGLESV